MHYIKVQQTGEFEFLLAGEISLRVVPIENNNSMAVSCHSYDYILVSLVPGQGHMCLVAHLEFIIIIIFV